MTTHRARIYTGFERFWHWTQALLIIILMVTGFEIHGSYSLLGYETATRVHTVVAWAFIGLIAFAIFWHLTTGAWRQYVPSKDGGVFIQGRYYLYGIFKSEAHPYRKTELSKLNPLQKATYLGFKILIVPVMVTTGLLYMYFNSWPDWMPFSLGFVATIHAIGAFLLVIFLIAHVYMTTTGSTPLANIEAMITGYEDIEDDPESEPTESADDEPIPVS